MINFVGHRRADLAEQLPCPIEGPVVRGHSFRGLKQLVRESISRALIRHERRGVALAGQHRKHRIREQLGITESVGNSVGGYRILEIAGIANQRPAVSPTHCRK